MAFQGPSLPVPIEWWSREQLPFTLMIILGIIGLILSEGGYRLGWWNDAHLAGIIISAMALGLGVIATCLRDRQPQRPPKP